MLRLLSSFLLVTVVLACDVTWPNGTDANLNWWQCQSGANTITFYNATPYDASGKNFEYPIHLSKPIVMKTDAFPPHTYTEPNLRNTVNLWSWGGFTGCSWNSLPTFGLLSNLDACTNGVPCPVKAGRQEFDVVVDFSQFEQIISLLKDNAPYQVQYILNDKVTNDVGCLMFQARAYIQ